MDLIFTDILFLNKGVEPGFVCPLDKSDQREANTQIPQEHQCISRPFFKITITGAEPIGENQETKRVCVALLPSANQILSGDHNCFTQMCSKLQHPTFADKPGIP